VSSVILPGRPDSGGSQFFVCVVDQPALDGHYTVFGRVAEGLKVVQKISESPVDEKGKATDFFICTAPAPGLDRRYTAFGRVVDGMAVVEAIEAAPVDGEKPTTRIEVTRARVTKVDR